MWEVEGAWRIVLEIVGWTGSAIIVWSMLQQRIRRLRRYNLVGCLVQIVYNGLLGVWPVVALNVVLAGVQLHQLWLLRQVRADPRRYDIVEVSADSDVLVHLLRRHHAEIARFHPEFAVIPDDAEAFLVLDREEIAGYVLLRRERGIDGDIAHVELDHVTERYRDFSAGEFVFRRSGILRRHGYTKVITAPGVVDAYYPQIGFRPVGDRYELEIAESEAAR